MLTQADYAKRRGCSKVAVHKAVKSGRITLVDGKVDPAAADRDWQARSLPRVGNSPAPKKAPPVPEPPPAEEEIDARGAPNFQEERARRERGMADQAEMEAAKMRGDLVPVADVERQWATEASRQREAWLQFAERMTPVLEMRPAGFIRQTLDVEVRQILAGLAR